MKPSKPLKSMENEEQKDTVKEAIGVIVLLGVLAWGLVVAPIWILKLKADVNLYEGSEKTPELAPASDPRVQQMLKLNYLWQQLPEKERCRFEEEMGLLKVIPVGYDAYRTKGKEGFYVDMVIDAKMDSLGKICNRFLEKTDSTYKIK